MLQYQKTVNNGSFNYDQLTIGEMAKIYHISTQTLRLYDKMNIFKPAVVNKSTGYRYYKVEQCAHLDLVFFMKSMGMGLDAIKKQLNLGDVQDIKSILKQQLQHIEQRMYELQKMRETITMTLTSYDHYLNAPPDGLITTEYIPTRKIYVYPLEENYYDMSRRRFEMAVKQMHNHVRANQLPAFGLVDIGNLIRKPELERFRLVSRELFLPVGDSFPSDKVEVVPSGLYICIYCDSNYKEVEYTRRLFDYIKQNKLTIAGDFLCEVVASLPAFKEGERNMYIRIQASIKY